MHSFFWLYLTISAPDFQLVPLDHIALIQTIVKIINML